MRKSSECCVSAMLARTERTYGHPRQEQRFLVDDVHSSDHFAINIVCMCWETIMCPYLTCSRLLTVSAMTGPDFATVVSGV